MDFFEQQNKARKKTGRLILLFIIAVIGLIISTYLVVMIPLVYFESDSPITSDGSIFELELFLTIATAITLLVWGVSLFKMSSLKSGGRVVAESLGGTLIESSRGDGKYRQLLNIVEEMAIASGTPVPNVYVLESEMGINAFAAGYNPGDAVIGVTKGAIETFSRDEMQGVIAHEFSHILNGDMKMNIRLIGVLAGILAISSIGRILIHSRGGSSREKNNYLPLIGIGLLIIGGIGVLIGRMIKAAVSRQREFLADASSVQFTRNPSGIYNALFKIMKNAEGSKIESANAEEASHLFFGNALSSFWGEIFATHPPLAERLKEIKANAPALVESANLASIAKAQEKADLSAKADEKSDTNIRNPEERFKQGVILAGGRVTSHGQTASRPVMANARVDEEQISYARQIIDSIPSEVQASAREPFGARAVIYGLLIDSQDESVRAKQLLILRSRIDSNVGPVFEKIWKSIQSLSVSTRIPLIDICIPSLRKLSNNQYNEFRGIINSLIQADNVVSIMEWSLWRILSHHLNETFEKKIVTSANDDLSSHSSTKAAEVVLSFLASRMKNATDAKTAFGKASVQLGIPSMQYHNIENVLRLDPAMDVLEKLKPLDKKLFLQACAMIIGFDSEVTAEEAELFRAFGDSLNSPIPLILPGQRLF
ncbi:M48 family metallopeptidase [Leptospira sp. GIMC2001]|uniref:M48 family metallopeptidase n=1 Tax=Leptospira sp. GIMC2001 TaxID=1513297 RepID=UPI002348F334|nr:M48 family metallopeptidase [Leptospira sp. GIMC2001]WCL50072.1 M48 family metallopeptidase [Leptospira sp. GIMC2001]